MEPLISITRERLDRDALLAAVSHPSVGGIVVFEGVVRDNARGKQVRYLEYDVYPEMAVQQIREIVAEAERRWGVERVAVAHRVGKLEIGEASVIIVVASPAPRRGLRRLSLHHRYVEDHRADLEERGRHQRRGVGRGIDPYFIASEYGIVGNNKQSLLSRSKHGPIPWHGLCRLSPGGY